MQTKICALPDLCRGFHTGFLHPRCTNGHVKTNNSLLNDTIYGGSVDIFNLDLKGIRKFFFKTITKVLDGISGITKNIYFLHFKACEWRNFDFCVFFRMCSGSGGRVEKNMFFVIP